MKIKDILRNDFKVTGNTEMEMEMSGINYDSRKIRAGELFVAVRGGNFDGNEFIGDAVKNGAAAIVYETGTAAVSDAVKSSPDKAWIGVDDSRDAMAYIAHVFYGRPSEKVTVIGITGTNGKTTTSYLLRAILEKYGKDTGLIGTINYLIKDVVYDAPHTTPEASDFQRLLKEMHDGGCGFVVTEVSSHALSQKRVDYTSFRVGIFTNLTRDHLDFHKTMEDYYTAKERLFTELVADGGVAVINIDDHYGEKLADKLKGQGKKVIAFSVDNPAADIRACDIKTTFSGTAFGMRINCRGSETGSVHEIFSPLVGIPNIYNVLSAAGAALALNIPINTIKEGIAMMTLVKGRFEKVDVGQEFLAVVDYAHTEDALERLLLTARQLLEAYHVAEKTEKMMKAKRRDFSITEQKDRGKIIMVFGCGGNRDKGKRSKMGEIAARLSDFVIITSDNPRGEDPKRIIREIEKGIKGDNYIVIQDRNVAISMAVELASPGDIVLVAGKGHEDYQEIQGIRHSFSDRTALENSIRRTISRPAFGGGTNYRGTEAVRC